MCYDNRKVNGNDDGDKDVRRMMPLDNGGDGDDDDGKSGDGVYHGAWWW